MLLVFKTAGILPKSLKIPFQFLTFQFQQFLPLNLVADSVQEGTHLLKRKTIMARGC
jgi:hypothetical protein